MNLEVKLFFFSVHILLRDSSSLNPREMVPLLYGKGGAGAAHGPLNLCVPKGDHQLPLSYKLRHGLRPPAKPSFNTFFFCCCWGAQPPWCRLASPYPLSFLSRQTQHKLGLICLTGLLLHDQGRNSGLNKPRWLQMLILSVAISKILFGSLSLTLKTKPFVYLLTISVLFGKCSIHLKEEKCVCVKKEYI